VVTRNVVIFGAGFGGNQSGGARTTIIDARGASRVLQVSANSQAILAGVTLTGGRADVGGGALIDASGTLFLYNSIVDGNVATIRGGGIAAGGTIQTVGTTISGNRVTGGTGGGIAIDSTGDGGMFASTVSGNNASGPGGGIWTAGSLTAGNVTIAGNEGGGLLQAGADAGATNLVNSIIAGGSRGTACGGAIAAPHFSWHDNLAADSSCQFAAGEGVVNDPQLGALRNNGGPTDTRAIAAGSPARDNGSQCWGQDQRGAQYVGTCDIGAFEFGGKPPQPEIPPPVPGETVNANRSRGTVKVKLPGSDEFFVLQDGQQLPVGTTFDTSKGRVNLVAAKNTTGGTQRAWFYRGVFKVGQGKGRKPLTTLSLTGKVSCSKGAGYANTARKKKRKRRLWGDGRGRFRTRGQFSSATVRGTKWLVVDRCDGTLTRVKRGKVAVRDFVRKRTVVVKAGHRYLAKRKK
jgi:hypothetical protein